MPLNFVTPTVGKYKKHTKDFVMTVLAENHPLTLRKITNAINQNYEVSVTYQAVRKAVNSLVDSEVLVKGDKGYSINGEWILDSRAFIDKLQKDYFKRWKPLEKSQIGKNVATYSVKNLVEVEKLWGDLVLEWIKGAKPGEVNTFQIPHLWLPIGHLEWEGRQMVTLGEKGVDMYAICYSDTFLDRVAVKFYRDIKIKANIVNDPDYNRGCEIGTYGDMVIQTYWPQKIVDAMEEYFGRIERIEDLNLGGLIDIAKMKSDITVTVMRNSQIAKQIRLGFMKQFK